MKINIFISSMLILFLNGCATKSTNDLANIYKFNIDTKDEIFDLSKDNDFSLHETRRSDKSINNVDSNLTEETPPFIFYKMNHRGDSLEENDKKNQEMVTINLDNIEIAKFSKLIFGQILKLNYTLDSGVEKSNKKVTLQIQNPVSQEELYKIAERIIENNGFFIEENDDYYNIKVGKNSFARNTYGTNFYYGRDVDLNQFKDMDEITIFIPYYYTDLRKHSNLFLRYYLSPRTALIDFITNDNVMLVKDKVKNIKSLLTFINVLDNIAMKNKFTKLIYLDYLDSTVFGERIGQILPNLGIPISKSLKGVGVLVENIPEINALLVISDKKEWLESISFWKAKLDTLDLNDDEQRIYIYKPKNRKSDELKGLVEELFTEDRSVSKNVGKESSVKTKKTTSVVAVNTNSDRKKLKVIEDTTRNVLIFYSTSNEYKEILEMLKKLDTLPKQVLVEVTIAELTLRDSLQYGLEWFLKNEGEKYNYEVSTLGNLGIGGSGLAGSLSRVNGDFSAILNAFAQDNLINILSSPKLVVLDNQAASITVGTDVPILSSSSTLDTTGSDQKTTQNFEYRKTGIQLSIKPTIHSEGTLTLDISQSNSEAQQNNVSAISSPIVTNRAIKTKVVLKSNQSLLLGGMIRENKSDTFTKVPLLGDIPFVGNFFKTTSVSNDKTELMVIVKPVIMNTVEESRVITEGMQKMMSKVF